jgi:hypothetical protein
MFDGKSRLIEQQGELADILFRKSRSICFVADTDHSVTFSIYVRVKVE